MPSGELRSSNPNPAAAAPLAYATPVPLELRRTLIDIGKAGFAVLVGLFGLFLMFTAAKDARNTIAVTGGDRRADALTELTTIALVGLILLGGAIDTFRHAIWCKSRRQSRLWRGW